MNARRRTWLLGAAVAVLGLGALGPLTTAGPTPIGSTGVERVEHVLGGWVASKGEDVERRTAFQGIEVTTPQNVAAVDIVLTLTTDYRTTAGGWVAVDAVFGADGGPLEVMRPGRFRLSSHDTWNTSTLTWVERNVAASGQTYDFSFNIDPRIGQASGVEAEGKKMSVVIEMWSVGQEGTIEP